MNLFESVLREGAFPAAGESPQKLAAEFLLWCEDVNEEMDIDEDAIRGWLGEIGLDPGDDALVELLYVFVEREWMPPQSYWSDDEETPAQNQKRVARIFGGK